MGSSSNLRIIVNAFAVLNVQSPGIAKKPRGPLLVVFRNVLENSLLRQH